MIVIGGYIFPYISFFPVEVLIFLFAAKKVLPRRYAQLVYPIAVLFTSAVLLNEFLEAASTFSVPLISLVHIPLTFLTLSSVMYAVSIIIILEALSAEKLIITIAEYVGSLLLLLEQLAAVAIMLSTDTILQTVKAEIVSYLGAYLGTVNPSPYMIGYITAIALEGNALYSLVVQGYQFYLPLSTFATPVDLVIPYLFIISAAAIFVSLYNKEPQGNINRYGSLGVSIIVGVFIGLPVLLFAELLAPYDLAIFVLGICTTAMFLAIGLTSRRVPANESINTSIKL